MKLTSLEKCAILQMSDGEVGVSSAASVCQSAVREMFYFNEYTVIVIVTDRSFDVLTDTRHFS